MARDLAPVRRSVIKILTHADPPNYDQPWQTHGASSAVGSGSIVETARGPRVLTNGHVVENQVFVEVRRFGKSQKFVAEVEGVGHVCDLALLTVADPDFFTDAEPLKLGALPELGEEVTVLGYPIGGDRLSLTQGVVSRIEMTHYAQTQRQLLACQIDAAINSGNSGGPVIDDDGRIVGVAFQAYDEGQNIGYMIGAPVVRHFLEDLEDGTFDGFPDLGVTIQNLESPAHRRWLRVPEDVEDGVLVSDVVFEGSSDGILERGDVILKIDGTPIAADASILFNNDTRIHFSHLVSQRHVGEKVTIDLWRRGEPAVVEAELHPPRFLVHEDRYDLRPTYYSWAGFLFVPLSRDFLKTWGDEWWVTAPSDLLTIYQNEVRHADRREVVVLQKVLADQANRGYHDWESYVVEKAMGQKIRDLRHLISVIESADGEYVHIETHGGSTIVVDRAEAAQRHQTILDRFGLPGDRSEDLK